MFYPATMDVVRKWTGRVQNWGQILLLLSVFFPDPLAVMILGNLPVSMIQDLLSSAVVVYGNAQADDVAQLVIPGS